MREWLPEGHLAYYINDTVDSLDLQAFPARYAGGGSRTQPFHPAMMVKVLIYGYATGCFSSRKLARKLHEDVAFRLLGAGNFPAHRTLSNFRAFHLKELSDLFVQAVRLALRGASEALQSCFDKAFIKLLVGRLVATNEQVAEWDLVAAPPEKS